MGQPLFTKQSATFWGTEFPASYNFVENRAFGVNENLDKLTVSSPLTNAKEKMEKRFNEWHSSMEIAQEEYK